MYKEDFDEKYGDLVLPIVLGMAFGWGIFLDATKFPSKCYENQVQYQCKQDVYAKKEVTKRESLINTDVKKNSLENKTLSLLPIK